MSALLRPNPAPAALPAPAAGHVLVASDLLGALEVPEAACYTFDEGLYAFEACRGFALVPTGRDGVWWLQSRDHAGLVFVVADPFHFFPGYTAEVPDAELAPIGTDGQPTPAERLLTLAIVTLPMEQGETASANLRAPLLLDTATRRGRQLVLPASPYGVREAIGLG